MSVEPIGLRTGSNGRHSPISPLPTITTAHHTFLSCKYFPLLDGLRCLSIVAVVWFHATGSHFRSGILSRGYLGVSLFFVISGFLITTLLLREQSNSGKISVRLFYLRRIFRIFPLYYAILTVYVLAAAFLTEPSADIEQFWRNLPYFLTYTSNWFVQLDSDHVPFYFAWSLATEEQFYLFWPWVLKASPKPYLPLGVMTIMLIIPYSVGFALNSGVLDPTWFFTRVLLSLSPPICLGAIAAVLMHQPVTFRCINRLIGWRYSPIFALTFLLASLQFDATPDGVRDVAMTWLVVACVLCPDEPLGRVLTNPLVKHVGIVSYGIYLMHMLSINVARAVVFESEGFLVFLVALPISIFVATLSYHFFELPFLRLKDRFGKVRRQSASDNSE